MTNVSKKKTNEPRRKRTLKNIKNIKNSEQSGGGIEELRSVFIEDITDWQNKDNEKYFSADSSNEIIENYIKKESLTTIKKCELKHENILKHLDPKIQSDLFIFGTQQYIANLEFCIGSPLVPTAIIPISNYIGDFIHPNFLGIITTKAYKGTHDQIINDINKKFDALEEYVIKEGKVHIPLDNNVYINPTDGLIQMGLGTIPNVEDKENPAEWNIQQDLLYYRVAKLSVLTLQNKLKYIDDFLTIYTTTAYDPSKNQRFLPNLIINSIKKKKTIDQMTRDVVLILPRDPTDLNHKKDIKNHLLFRHPIHYSGETRWGRIDKQIFTSIFGYTKNLVTRFDTQVRGLRTDQDQIEIKGNHVCPGDTRLKDMWYGILGWTNWIDEAEDDSISKDELDAFRPTKDGAYILHTWGVNLEDNKSPHYKYCFSETGIFNIDKYKELLTNTLSVIKNAITHLKTNNKGKTIQVRISKLGFGAWQTKIPKEHKTNLLETYTHALLSMYEEKQVVIKYVDYPHGTYTSIRSDSGKNEWVTMEIDNKGEGIDVNGESFKADPFGKRIQDEDTTILLLVNAWDDASFIGNGGSNDPTLDGWMVTGCVFDDWRRGINNKHLGHYAKNYSYLHNVFFQPQLLDEANWIVGEEINIDSPQIEPLNLYERLIKKFDKIIPIFKENDERGAIRFAEESQKKVSIINDLLKKKEGDPIEALVQIAKNIDETDEKSIALNTALDNMDEAEKRVEEAEVAAKPHRAEINAALTAAQEAYHKKANNAHELRARARDLIKQFDDGEVRKNLDAAESYNGLVQKQFYKSFKAWEESIKEKMKEVVEQLLNAEPENQMVIDLSDAFDIKKKAEADPNRADADKLAAEQAERAAAERAAAERAAAERAAADKAAKKGWRPWGRKKEEEQKPDQYHEEARRQANERARSSAKYYQEQAEAIARGFKTSEEMAQYIKEKQIYIGYEYDNEYTSLNFMNKKIEIISNKDFLSELDTRIRQLSEEIEQKTEIQEKIKPDALSMAILQAELIMMQTKKNLVTADIKKKLEPKEDYVKEVYDQIAKIKDDNINANHIISVIDIAKAMGDNAKEYYEDMRSNEPMNVDQAAALYLKNRQAKIIELANLYKPDHGDDANKILEALLISFEIKKDQVEKKESFSLYNQEETTKDPKVEAVAVARGFFTLDEMDKMLKLPISEKDTRPLYENKNNYYDMIPIYVKTTKTDLIVAEMEQLNKSKIIVESAVARGEDPAINNAKLKMMRVRFEILRALLIIKQAYENEDGDKNEEGLRSEIQNAFDLQFLLWKETILIAREIGNLKLDDKLTENIKLKVKEMITKDPALTSNSILLGLKQAFNFEDPIPRPHVAADIDAAIDADIDAAIDADINAAIDAAVDTDIYEAVVNDPKLGAKSIVAAKKTRPNNPIPEFGVDNWLAKVKDPHKLIAEAESEDLHIDSKYKQEWVEWRTSQLNPDWKNIYNPALWEEKKKEIDVKLEQELQQKIARPAANAQQSMLDQILKVVLGDAKQAVAQPVVAQPVVARPADARSANARSADARSPAAVVARPLAAVVAQPADAQPADAQQAANFAQMHVSSIYQEDNSSSYMFYIPIVGILIGISSMFLIK